MAYTLSHNTPTTGFISWAGVDIVFDGVSYAVADGDTSQKYVYWLKAEPDTLQVSDEYPSLTAEDCLVFINNGGAGLSVLDATVMDGSIIVPGTIQGDAIMAEAIVGSHIAAESIVGTHILAGEITGDHIKANSITAEKIDARGLVIRDGEGNPIFGVGTNLDVGYIGGLDEKIAESIAPTVVLSASSQIITYDGLNKLSPASQVITLTAKLQNAQGVPVFTATVYDALGEQIVEAALNGEGTQRQITGQQFNDIVGAHSVKITVTVGDLTDTVTVTKVSDGFQGANGVSATSYWLTATPDLVVRDAAGNYVEPSIRFAAMKQTGEEAPVSFAGRFLIEVTSDGSAYTQSFASANNESSVSFDLPPDVKSVRATLTSPDGAFLDTTTVAIVEDGISYDVKIESTNGTIFKVGEARTTTLVARVFRNGVEVTDSIPSTMFQWTRASMIPHPDYDDGAWNASHAAGYKSIVVNVDDVYARATFICRINS